MRTTTDLAAHDRRRIDLGTTFGWAAVICLALIAPIMAVAHRSSPLMLTLAGSFAVGSVLVEGRWLQLWSAARAALLSPLGMAATAFLAWALVSVAWSPAPSLSLFAWGEFVLPIGMGLAAGLILPDQMGRMPAFLMAGGLALAALLILLDLSTGLAARQALGMRAAAFVLNRPALTLLVLLPVSTWLLLREGRTGLAAGLVILVAAAILRSESGAAKLGLACEAVMAGLALASRRAALALSGGALLGALATAPVAGGIADMTLPERVYRVLARAHAQDRVDIWRSFGVLLRHHPLAGYGFDASPRLASIADVPEPFAVYLGVGHPHSAALQIWVELGAVGCFLAALVAVLAVRAASALPRAECAVVTSIVAAALADSLVGQGAWQGWWPAALAAAMVWLGYGRARARHDERVSSGAR